jgi:hypothetical protein
MRLTISQVKMKRPSSPSPKMDSSNVSEHPNAVESTPSPLPNASPALKKAKKSPTKTSSTSKTSYKDKRIEPSSPKGKLLAYYVKLAMKTADKGDVERMVCSASSLPVVYGAGIAGQKWTKVWLTIYRLDCTPPRPGRSCARTETDHCTMP